jgi:hypothetical protein
MRLACLGFATAELTAPGLEQRMHNGTSINYLVL